MTNEPGSMKQALAPTKDEIKKVLKNTKSIAVVGLSDDETKPAFEVAKFLKEKGYRIIPVHPKAETVLGETVYPSLAKIPGAIDMVYMFRNADAAVQLIDQAISKGARAFWMPEGVVNDDAASIGRAAGIVVVMDRCAKKELSA